MMCEPQVFGLWAGSSLAKMPSDGRAGGPRLGLDTSLMYSAQNYEIKVQIFSGYLKEVYSNLNILEKNYCTFVHF